MKKLIALLSSAVFAALTFTAQAATYHVATTGNNANPGTPISPKRTIQAAINIAAPGDTVIVADGTYAPITTANKAITIQSVNGAAVTIIDGGGTARCATLGVSDYWWDWWWGTDTILTGFTLANGWASSGGGAVGGTLNNCTLAGNTADSDGGGAYNSTLNTCTVTGNTAYIGGGVYGSTLNNCTITGNTAGYAGGGASDSTLDNCTITGNTADVGGGVFGYGGNILNTCILTENRAYNGGGAYDVSMNNCILIGNTADNDGGGVCGFYSTLNNCTLVGNSAGRDGGGAYYASLNNCIVWGNTATGQTDNHINCTIAYSCTSPLPAGGGGGNTDLAPLFTDAANGDYRPGPGSPCIDTGNDSLIGGLTDLDGKPRLLGEAVDMGAYETGTPPAQMQNQLYVDETRTDNSGDGTTWGTAKRTIPAAIVIAADGATITVAGGTYAPIMTANKPITIQSANGAGATTIDGGGALRCATLGTDRPHTNTVLTGFTLMNGRLLQFGRGGGVCGGTLNQCALTANEANSGGGAYCSVLNDCTLTANTADDSGGGAYESTLNGCTLTENEAYYGGGTSYCTLNGCTLTDNEAYYGGGTSYGTLNGCTLSENLAFYNGGGAYDSILTTCTITGNSARSEAGGTYLSTLNNCLISGNSAYYGGGASDSILNSCMISGNMANDTGGAHYSTLNNCTITENEAIAYWNDYWEEWNGGSIGGTGYCTLNNCIVWNNTADDSYANHFDCTFAYSCTLPLPDSGDGNIDNDPHLTGGNRLSPGSPCIDTASDTRIAGLTDLDGKPRLLGEAVDMGAYEFGTPPAQMQNQLYVDEARLDNSGDGTTWGTAKRTIPAAIVIAADGATITVANGTYAPIATVNKPVTIQSVNGAGATLIDGGGTTRCATLGTGWPSTNTVLTGFTLTNGCVYGSGGGAYGGTLNTCTLTANTATIGGYPVLGFSAGNISTSTVPWENDMGEDEGAPPGNGGGACYSILNTCTLTGNKADCYGGGAYRCILTDCTFTQNEAGDGGGGAHTCVLTGCTLTENEAGYSGGGTAGSVLTDCVLTENTATWSGGGAVESELTGCTLTGNIASDFYGNGGGAAWSMLTDCTLTNNEAPWDGGGAYDSTLNNCTLTGNEAWQNGGGAYGGELTGCTLTDNTVGYSGGGSYDSTLNNCLLMENKADYYGGGASYGDLHNCLLAGNFASEGGGAYNAMLYNCTITGNDAYTCGGGAIDSEIGNCIVWGNTAGDEAPNYSGCTIDYSCTSPLPDGDGNIGGDPLFVDAANGNYRLRPGSPCINAGSSDLVDGTTDLDGNPRIIALIVDMGAYEWDGTAILTPYQQWLLDTGLVHDTPANHVQWLIDPNCVTNTLTARIHIIDGAPHITWEPNRPDRIYTVWGAPALDIPITTPTNNATRFFRVRVEE